MTAEWPVTDDSKKVASDPVDFDYSAVYPAKLLFQFQVNPPCYVFIALLFIV